MEILLKINFVLTAILVLGAFVGGGRVDKTPVIDLLSVASLICLTVLLPVIAIVHIFF